MKKIGIMNPIISRIWSRSFTSLCLLGTSALCWTLSLHAQTQSLRWLKSFGFPEFSLGGYPQSPLIEGRDGQLYGTAGEGGAHGEGVVFRIAKNGDRYTVLHSFERDTDDGMNPMAGLLQGHDGILYGTTTFGGAQGQGTLFMLKPDGSGYKILHSFGGPTDPGANPETELVEGRDGLSRAAGTSLKTGVYEIDQDIG
jgi:uncharacterized repeat protein (TIGR03803 family)